MGYTSVFACCSRDHFKHRHSGSRPGEYSISPLNNTIYRRPNTILENLYRQTQVSSRDYRIPTPHSTHFPSYVARPVDPSADCEEGTYDKYVIFVARSNPYSIS